MVELMKRKERENIKKGGIRNVNWCRDVKLGWGVIEGLLDLIRRLLVIIVRRVIKNFF